QEAQGAMDRRPGPRGAVRAGQALTEAWRYRAACQVAAAEAEVAYRRVVALGNRPVPAEVTEGAQQLRFVLRDVLCALARLEAVRADATPAGRRTSGRYHIDDGARSAASTRLREVREEMQAGPPSEIVEAAAMAKARTL
ncbi:MAG: hypothetical protein J2P43_06965, partial [Candidatus Dormibacteraeota bacterium]|nr:hypothetical protein [Candidatus Dormibacteraeota bacterium]